MKKRYTFLPKNWLRFGLAAAFAASFSLNLQAQIAPVKQWDKGIGGSNDDSPNVILKTSSGGFIIGGWSNSGIGADKTQASKGILDFWLVMTDAGGNKLWDKTYGGTGVETITRMTQTADGGFILGGSSTSGISGDKSQPNIGNRDFWIVKIDANGTKQWDKTFGGTGDELFYGVQQTTDGGYLIGGLSDSGISGDKTQPSKGWADYWIIKLDGSGSKQWDKTFGGNQEELLDGLQQTSDGGYVLFGRSYSNASGDKSQPSKGGVDFWIVKLDVNGNKAWDKTLGGNNDEGWLDLKQTPDNGFIIGGTSKSGISGDKTQACQGDMDYWILKLDPSGNKIWDKTYGGNGYDEMAQIQLTSNGDVVIAGFSNSGLNGDKSQASNGGNDFWMLKLNSSGNKIWDKTLGGAQDDFLYSLQQTSDGGYILVGESQSGISGDKTQASKGMKDFWLVKLSPDLLGIEESSNPELNLYPNPTTSILNLELANPINAQVKVYNALGQCILTKTISRQEKQTTIDLANAAKGIYTIQVIAEKQSLVKKIVLE